MHKKEVKLFLLISLFFIVSLQFVGGHVEHAEPSVQTSSVWYQIFIWHDWLHPLFYLFLIYSCYFYRFFSGRKFKHEPKKCLGDCSKCYKPEGWLHQYHRYFLWGTLLLAFIHVGEIMPSLTRALTYTGYDLWILVSESSYLAVSFLYLGTCYHVRYVVERMAKKKWVSYKFYNGLTSLNRHHHIFFWLTIGFVAIRFILVAIETGSILQAIPGTF